jgi:Catalase
MRGMRESLARLDAGMLKANSAVTSSLFGRLTDTLNGKSASYSYRSRPQAGLCFALKLSGPKGINVKKTAVPKTPAVKKTSEGVGNGGEFHQFSGGTHPQLTTQQGQPISDDENSLKLSNTSRPGPVLLEDFVLREKINHFDHERIPERIVHARGAAAHGYFELTDSLEKFTRARVLGKVGEKVPRIERGSTT